MNLDFKWKIFYTEKAADDLRDLPKVIQKRIVAKMRFFASANDLHKFAKPLKNKGLGDFRFRVGGYRIIFDIVGAKKEIIIHKIAKRDEIYK